MPLHVSESYRGYNDSYIINIPGLHRRRFPRVASDSYSLPQLVVFSKFLLPKISLTLTKLSKDWFLNKKIKFYIYSGGHPINLIRWLAVSTNFLVSSFLEKNVIICRFFGIDSGQEELGCCQWALTPRLRGLMCYSLSHRDLFPSCWGRSFFNSTRDKCNRIFILSFQGCGCV